MLYSVSDQTKAKTTGDSIIGVLTGKTILNLTTKEFGGTSQIEVNVTPKQDPTPTPVPGGSSGGSGGTGAGPMVDKIME